MRLNDIGRYYYYLLRARLLGMVSGSGLSQLLVDSVDVGCPDSWIDWWAA